MSWHPIRKPGETDCRHVKEPIDAIPHLNRFSSVTFQPPQIDAYDKQTNEKYDD